MKGKTMYCWMGALSQVLGVPVEMMSEGMGRLLDNLNVAGEVETTGGTLGLRKQKIRAALVVEYSGRCHALTCCYMANTADKCHAL